MTELRFTKLRRLFVLLYVVLIVSPNPWPRFRQIILSRSPMFSAPTFQPSHPTTGAVVLTPRIICQPLGNCPHVVIRGWQHHPKLRPIARTPAQLDVRLQRDGFTVRCS